MLSIAFPVTGKIIEDRRQQAELDLQLQEEVGRLLVEGTATQLPHLSELSNEQLGATPTRYSMQGRAPYVGRPGADNVIRELLTVAVPPFPFVLVWGTTKAGKTRTTAEAVRAVFREMSFDPAVIMPRNGQALAELAYRNLSTDGFSPPTVVWLDDVNATDLEALSSSVLDTVSDWGIIVATITAARRHEILRTGSSVGAVARAAMGRATQFELQFNATEEEEAEARLLYPAEEFGGSIAETLVGGRELTNRYRASQDTNPPGCAVLRAAIDFRRAGVSRPISESELRHLFPLYLREVRVDLLPTDERFAEGIEWATRPVASQVALLRPIHSSAQEHTWSVFDHVVTADDDPPARPIPAQTWRELIDMVPAHDAVGLGLAANARGQIHMTIDAFRKASTADDQITASQGAISLGLFLAQQGRTDEARAAFQQAIDSGHEDFAPQAALALGLFLQQTETQEAQAAFQQAIDSGHPIAAPQAAAALGLLLQREGDTEAARAALQQAIDSDNPLAAPQAFADLGILLKRQGDIDGAKRALQRAIDSGHRDAAPQAAVTLGLLLQQTDVHGAQAAFVQALKSAHPDATPKAASILGVLLKKHGHMDGAKAALRLAIDSGHPDAAPQASAALGDLLQGEGDTEGARAALQRAIDSGHPEAAPIATAIQGVLLNKQGDVDGAKAALQRAMDSGHPDAASFAAGDLGILLYLQEQSDIEGAKAALQRAIDSGHPDAAPKATAILGHLLADQNDIVGAKAALQRAIDTGHPDYASLAAAWLGSLLAELGDVDGARAASQLAIDSGHPRYAPKAAATLAALHKEQSNVDGDADRPPPSH